MRPFLTGLFLSLALFPLFPSSSPANERQVVLSAEHSAEAAEKEALKAEEDMEKILKYARGKTTQLWQNKLDALQKMWLSYRKYECEFETANYVGALSYATVLENCYVRMTYARIRELQNYECVKGTALICGN